MGALSVSILSCDFAHLGDQVKLVAPFAEAIHVDVMDGHFAPPITIGSVVVASLRPVTDLTLHGHLMVDAPAEHFDAFAEAGLDMVSFHHEAVADPVETIAKARSAGLGVGITLNKETPVEVIYPYLDDVDDVMLMSILPGWAGQVLDENVYPRLEAVRNEIDRRGLDIALEIDGGVKVSNAKRAVDAGATVLIAATGIYRTPDPVEAARELAAIARGAA